MIVMNSELSKIYDIIKDISVSCFSDLAAGTSSGLSYLSSNLNSILDRFGVGGVWSDEVSREINGETRNGLSAMIEGCSEPACSLLKTIGISVSALISTLSTYLEKFEEYNRLSEERQELSRHEPSESVYDSRTKKYKDNPYWGQWNSKMNSYNNLINQLEKVILQLEEQGNSQVNNLRALLSPIGTSTSNAALNVGVSSSVREERIALDNGNSKVVVSILEDGRTVLDNYTIYDSSGVEIGYGSISYDSAGNKTVEQYLIYQDDGSIKYGTKDYTDPLNVKDTYFISNSDGSSSSGESIYDSSGNQVETSEKVIGKDGVLESEKTVISDDDISRVETMDYNGDGVGSRKVTIIDEDGSIIHEQDVGLIGIPADTPITIDGNNVTLNFNPNTYEGYDNIDEALTKLGVTSQGDKNKYINMLTGGMRELEINGEVYTFNLNGATNGDAGAAISNNSVNFNLGSSDVGNSASARSSSYSTLAEAISDYEGQGLSHEDAALAAEKAYAKGEFKINSASNSANSSGESGRVIQSNSSSNDEISSFKSYNVGDPVLYDGEEYSVVKVDVDPADSSGFTGYINLAKIQEDGSNSGKTEVSIQNPSEVKLVNGLSNEATSPSNTSFVTENVQTNSESTAFRPAAVETNLGNLTTDSMSIDELSNSVAVTGNSSHSVDLFNDVVSNHSGFSNFNPTENVQSNIDLNVSKVDVGNVVSDVPSFNNYKVGDSVWYEGEKYAVTSLNVDPSDPYGINGSAGLAKINNDGTTSGKTEFIIASPSELSPFDN